MSDSDEEFEDSLTSNLLKATFNKNVKMRSMVSQTIKDNSPRNRFQDEEPIFLETHNFDLEEAGLANLLKFKQNVFKKMRVDPFELTAAEIEEFEKRNQFDGKSRTIKEELFLPIKNSSKELLIWKNLKADEVVINKKNQRKILDEVERMLGFKISFKWGPPVDLITIIEDMFIRKIKAANSPLILFDAELD